MGQLIHFYMGNPEVIGKAFSGRDFARLRDRAVIPSQVDFSLHLSPIDFELLTEAAQRIVGSGPLSLEESLDKRVGGDGEHASADVVSADWVQMIGSLNDADLEPLLLAWAEALADEHGDSTIEPTDDVRRALRELVDLCREATHRQIPVVDTWSL